MLGAWPNRRQLDNRELHSITDLGDAVSFRPFAPEDSDLRAFKTNCGLPIVEGMERNAPDLLLAQDGCD